MKGARLFVFLLSVLLAAGQVTAKDIELRLLWQELPNSLVGQKIRVIQVDGTKIGGKLARIESDALVLEARSGFLNVPSTSTQRIETRRKLGRARGQIIGTAIGAGVGSLIAALALKYRNNENGSNSDSIVGASVGLAVGATLLGYWSGRQSDGDRTVIYVISK